MNTLIINVATAIIVALLAAVTNCALPYLKAKKDEALASLRRTRWSWAADIIDAVVRAVEQTVAGKIHGADKKAFAINYIKPLLAKNGITISDMELDQLIEAAVQAMNAEVISVETDTIPETEDEE